MTRPDDGIRWAIVWAAVLLVLVLLGTLARVEAAPLRAVCAAAVAEWGGARDEADAAARAATCERLAQLAAADQVPVALVLALAYEEAHFDPAPRRMCSTLQVSRKWHCPGCGHRACERRGVALLGELLTRYEGDERRALCRYVAGRGACPEGFVGAVRQRAAAFERRLAAAVLAAER